MNGQFVSKAYGEEKLRGVREREEPRTTTFRTSRETPLNPSSPPRPKRVSVSASRTATLTNHYPPSASSPSCSINWAALADTGTTSVTPREKPTWDSWTTAPGSKKSPPEPLVATCTTHDGPWRTIVFPSPAISTTPPWCPVLSEGHSLHHRAPSQTRGRPGSSPLRRTLAERVRGLTNIVDGNPENYLPHAPRVLHGFVTVHEGALPPTTIQIRRLLCPAVGWVFHDGTKRVQMLDALAPGRSPLAGPRPREHRRRPRSANPDAGLSSCAPSTSESPGWIRCAKLLMIGTFFNLFLLGSTGGDVVKIFYAMRENARDKAGAYPSA